MAGMGAIMGIIGAVGSIASAASSIFGGMEQEEQYDFQAEAQDTAADDQMNAAYEAELLADQNARNLESETYENVRREEEQLDQELGSQRARAAASGMALDDDGSLSQTMAASRKEGQTQIDWMKQAGVNQADIIRWEGDMARKTGVSSAQFGKSMAKTTKKRGDAAKWDGIFTGGTKMVNAVGQGYTAGQTAGWWGT